MIWTERGGNLTKEKALGWFESGAGKEVEMLKRAFVVDSGLYSRNHGGFGRPNEGSHPSLAFREQRQFVFHPDQAEAQY